MDGKLTVLALSHFGPENPSRGLAPLGFNADNYMRYLNDVVVTYKATDKLTLVTEANWIRDDFLGIAQTGKPGPANAFGAAQYLSYVLSDTATFNARLEVYRDAQNVFVTSFTGNNDFVRGELGLPFLSPVLAPAKPTTYGALTLGVTFKPNLPAPITGLLIRPEFRYDTSLNGTKPYKDGTATGQLTLSSDFVLTF
jgi:hypothetical protein